MRPVRTADPSIINGPLFKYAKRQPSVGTGCKRLLSASLRVFVCVGGWVRGHAYRAHSCYAGAAYNRARLDFRSTRPNWAFAFVALTHTLPLCLVLPHSLVLSLPLHVPRFVRNYDKKRFYLARYLPPSDVRTDWLTAYLTTSQPTCLADRLSSRLLPSTFCQPIIFVVWLPLCLCCCCNDKLPFQLPLLLFLFEFDMVINPRRSTLPNQLPLPLPVCVWLCVYLCVCDHVRFLKLINIPLNFINLPKWHRHIRLPNDLNNSAIEKHKR